MRRLYNRSILISISGKRCENVSLWYIFSFIYNSMKGYSYPELLEMIIDYNAALSKALIAYNYADIELYAIKIGKIIRMILNDNKIRIDK